MALPPEKTQNRKRILCFLLTLLLFTTPAFFCFASAQPSADVLDVNVGIRPSAYRRLIASTEGEPRFSVQVSVNDAPCVEGKLKLRGAASKAMGAALPGKRLPYQIKFGGADAFSGSLDNSCVKLINSYTPARLVGEYLALEMYDFMGIPTPAHRFAFLCFNGVDFGLYLALEDVNAEFTQKRFGDGGGSLYKADYQTVDDRHVLSNWFGSLRAVEDRGNARVEALIDALDRGEGYEAYLDVDETLRFFACLAAWGADSTILTEQNNFFLYDTGGKFILIPWDNSEAFAAYPSENGIDHYLMEPWAEPTESPIFDLLMRDPNNKDAYYAYIKKLNDEFLAPERIDPYFDSLARTLSPYLERDRTMVFNQPCALPVVPAEEYGTLNALLYTLHGVHDNLSAQLAGEASVFFGNPVYNGLHDMEGDPNVVLSFLTTHSPRLDDGITEKICDAYPVWCRSVGRIPFDADDPAEIALACIVFGLVFCIAAVFLRRKR